MFQRIAIIGFAVIIAMAARLSTAQAAVVTFYTDRTAFEAALTSTFTIDFEGIAPSGGCAVTGYMSPLYNEWTVENVTFSVPNPLTGFFVVDAALTDSELPGSPYKSDILFSHHADAITATLPTGFNAVGGFFGNANASGVEATLTVRGPDGILDTRILSTESMSQSRPDSNFFGWIVDGTTITSITHDLPGTDYDFPCNPDRNYEAIDDFVFGSASASAVPEPSAIIVWSLLGVLGLGQWWRRRQKA
jgi:hypothetical protein